MIRWNVELPVSVDEETDITQLSDQELFSLLFRKGLEGNFELGLNEELLEQIRV